jgi:type IV pilus assembly protein PilQ
LVREVRTSQYSLEPQPVTRLVFTVAPQVAAQVERVRDGLAVTFRPAGQDAAGLSLLREADAGTDPSSPLFQGEQVVYAPAGDGEPQADNWQTEGAAQLAQPVRQGEDASLARTISMNVQNSDIRTVLRSIADFSGRNVITSPRVTGSVTAAITDVPWREALSVILKANGFDYVEEYGVIRVDTIPDLRNEELERKAAMAKTDQLEALETRVVRIDFANAEEVQSAVKSMLTTRGSVEIDERTNSLIVTDIPSKVETLADLARQLDTQTPQVHINAMLVDMDVRQSEELGIQWGLFNGKPGGVNIAGDVSVTAPITDVSGLVRVATVQDFGELRAVVQAMARDNKADIISNPKITTTDNREARILVGQKIPLIVQDQAGNPITQLTTIGIQLTVTPHINSDRKITLDVHPEVSDLSSQATVQGGVIINTSEADTRVLVDNNETAVIGGLIRSVTSKFYSGVPVLKDLPLLGGLFRSSSKRDDQRELVVFLTPTIVDENHQIMTPREREMKERIDQRTLPELSDPAGAGR